MMSEVLAILISDMHIRLDAPECRTDDYVASQTSKLAFLSHMGKETNAPIIHAGDLFDYWNVTPNVISYMLEHLPEMWSVPGQHDLPYHRMDNLKDSAFHTLEKAGRIHLLDGESVLDIVNFPTSPRIQISAFPFGRELHPSKGKISRVSHHLAVAHHLTYVKNPFPGAKDGNVREVMKKLDGYDLILTGDNHQQFTFGNIVNPGSMMRMTAKQIDHKPAMYLWYGGAKTKRVEFPISKGDVSREHVDSKDANQERLVHFVESVGDFEEDGIDFEVLLKKTAGKQRRGVLQAVSDILGRAETAKREE